MHRDPTLATVPPVVVSLEDLTAPNRHTQDDGQEHRVSGRTVASPERCGNDTSLFSTGRPTDLPPESKPAGTAAGAMKSARRKVLWSMTTPQHLRATHPWARNQDMNVISATTSERHV